jgi:tripartite-type tricarboxylate transporter receptor subunit TctC
MTTRRALLAAPFLLPAARALAQPWQPDRPVQLVVGFAPGGGSDIIARTIAQAAQPLYPQPLVVLNRPGAGGALAAEQVARATPDGLTLLLAGGSESTSLPAHRTMPYDPRTAFAPIIRLTLHGQFITVAANSPHTTLAKLVAAAKVKPDAVTHASSGVGSLAHSAFVLLSRAAGVQMLHVPFTGGGPSLQALLAGQVDCAVLAPEEFAGQLQGGLVRLLGVASAQRVPAYPNVPTLREAGFDVIVENMKGFVAPAGTPEAILQSHHDRMRQAMAAPPWQAFMARTGEADGYANGPDFQAAMTNLLDSISRALRA